MTELLVLRLVHVLGGIFWVGGGLFAGLFLMPALSAAGPAAAPVLNSMEQRRVFIIVPAVAVLTILSGTRLMWIMSGGFSRAYFATPSGGTFGASGAAALIAFLLALLVARPAGARVARLASMLDQAVTGTEQAELARRLERARRVGARTSRVAMWLLLLSAAGMAVGRYVGWMAG